MNKYLELETWLKEKIKNDEFKPNSVLPTEEEMVRRFNLSKMTVRKVISNLKREGLIYSIQGKGFLVSPFKDIYILSEEKFDKEIILPTKTLIPNYLLKSEQYNLDLTHTNHDKWFSFLKLYFENNNVYKYSINWIYLENKVFDTYKEYNKIHNRFNSTEVVSKIRIVALEEKIKNDQNIFGLKLQKQYNFMPTIYKYSFDKTGQINKISMVRYAPEKFKVII